MRRHTPSRWRSRRRGRCGRRRREAAGGGGGGEARRRRGGVSVRVRRCGGATCERSGAPLPGGARGKREPAREQAKKKLPASRRAAPRAARAGGGGAAIAGVIMRAAPSAPCSSSSSPPPLLPRHFLAAELRTTDLLLQREFLAASRGRAGSARAHTVDRSARSRVWRRCSGERRWVERRAEGALSACEGCARRLLATPRAAPAPATHRDRATRADSREHAHARTRPALRRCRVGCAPRSLLTFRGAAARSRRRAPASAPGPPS